VKYLLSLIVLTLAAPLFAQTQDSKTFELLPALQCPGGRCPIQQPRPDPDPPNFVDTDKSVACCVVEVRMETGYGGSGTSVGVDGKPGLILTANHVVVGARKGVIIFHDGRKYPCQVLATEPSTDCAALVYTADADNRWTLLSDGPAAVGARLFKVGYPAGASSVGHPDIRVGRCVRSTGMLDTDIIARSGDSGGGYFDDSGGLAGNVWYGNERGSSGPGVQQLRKFMEEKCRRGQQPSPKPPGKTPGEVPPPKGPAVPIVVPVPVGPPVPDPAITALQKQISDLAAMVKTIPAGPAGKDGPAGPAGPVGPAGAADMTRIAALEVQVKDLTTQLAALQKQAAAQQRTRIVPAAPTP
jgi:hypothetical protein